VRIFLTALFIVFLVSVVAGQTTTLKTSVPDSILEKRHSPTRASLMSAFVPGLGQIYNKKYWKVPVIYAGFGIMTYFIVTNTDEYLNFKCAYIEKMNGTSNGNYKYLTDKYTSDELLSGREYYRRNLEISILITSLWYVLNILDATVDAHLFTYNISEDLSLKVDPVILGRVNDRDFSSGIRLSLRF
jgi:hypothetical protein